ncbi:MAG: hypothetical protein AB1476_03560 [Candidatus Hadarchaeota archaeon]
MTKERQELLLRVIDLCESVRSRGLDPFDVQVREFFDRLRELLPKIKSHEDMYLDVQALLGLADVVFQQGEWIKHKSSVLYLDPLLIMLKLHALSPQDLAEVFSSSWHPIVEIEAISPPGILEAKEYWTALPPLGERWRELDVTEVMTGEFARKELAKMGILSEEDFVAVLDKAWRDLKEAAGGGEVKYWDFIMEKSFERTAFRAWLVSFLVSYGYATLELKPLDEEPSIKPLPKPQRPERAQTFSVPISISRDEWMRRQKGG